MEFGRTLLALALAACVAPARAAEPDGAQWYALPVVFWTPETRLGFGALGGVQFGAAAGARPSYLQASAVYTLESQGNAQLLFDVCPSQRSVVSGEVRAAHFPDRFWGIGPRTLGAHEERYTSRHLHLELAPELYLLPGRLRAGPRVHFRREVLRDVEPGGSVAAHGVSAADPLTTIGLGATVTWDTRDSVFSPTRGTFARGWYVVHSAALAGGSDFGRGAADLRRFLPILRGHVLGLAAHLEAVHGAAPFTLYPKLGGAETLRGYYQGRWRDRAYWAAQGEYRFPIGWRFAGTVFAGVGGVAPAVRDLTEQPVRAAGGAGLRYRLTSAGVNVRGDVALGSEGMATYLLTMEAF